MRGDKLTVALVGRPNVGKSTVFNRLVGRRLALVYDRPGVTRDRRDAEAVFMGIPLRVVDTPGLIDPDTEDTNAVMHRGMYGQSMKAIEEAQIVIFIIDGIAGCTPHDTLLAQILRKTRKPVIVLVNKCEGKRGTQGLSDAAQFGFKTIIPVSAEHNEGFSDLFEVLLPYAPPEKDNEEEDPTERPLKVAIMGRPNVGKSTLMNALLKEERQLTGDMPGLTRDAIHVPWLYKDRPIDLVDTAGIRRKSNVQDAVEKIAVVDSERVLQFSEIVILVVDASVTGDDILEKQDLVLADRVLEEGRCLVLALNKWDKVADKTKALKRLDYQLDTQLAQAKGVACVPLSALKQENFEALMSAVFDAEKAWNQRISTGELNRWLKFVTEAHPAPIVNGRRIRLKYVTQIKTRPPTLALFCTKGDDLPDSYKRYLINTLKRDFKIGPTPIRLQLRTQKNPFEKG